MEWAQTAPTFALAQLFSEQINILQVERILSSFDRILPFKLLGLCRVLFVCQSTNLMHAVEDRVVSSFSASARRAADIDEAVLGMNTFGVRVGTLISMSRGMIGPRDEAARGCRRVRCLWGNPEISCRLVGQYRSGSGAAMAESFGLEPFS